MKPASTLSAALADELAAHPRGRVPRALRRRQLLSVAHDVFVERGYQGASMDEIARRMGISKPVVYALAGSKEQLFTEVMASVNAALAEAVAGAVSAEHQSRLKLRAGILAFLRFVEGRREAWVALASLEAGPVSAEIAAMRRRQALLVASLIVAGEDPAASGAVDPCTAEALAHAINGAVESVAMWWQDHPSIPAEALADLLTRAFSVDLLSLGAEPLPGGG